MIVHSVKLALSLAIAISNLIAPLRVGQLSQQISQNPPPDGGSGTPEQPTLEGTQRPGESKCPIFPTDEINFKLIGFMPRAGTTTQANPTFWFYVPYVPEKVDSFMFVLQDEQNRSIGYAPQPATLVGTPGFIKINLPPTVNLEIGQSYNWVLSVNCDRENKEDRIYVRGRIQRIAPRSVPLSTRECIDRYAEIGYQYDCFNLLAQQHQNNPDDPGSTAEWNQYLKLMKFEALAPQPFVDCCTLEPLSKE